MLLERSWYSWLVNLAVVISCATVLAGAGIAGLVLRRLDLQPPSMHVSVGEMHVVAFTSYPSLWATPSCPPTASRCRTRIFSPVYAVWLIDNRRLASSPRDAFYQLLVVPLSISQLVESLST
jgi:hypothetical protein